MVHRLFKTILFVLAFGSVIFSMSCSAIPTENKPTEDTSYLTPIPDATRKAFKNDSPVTNKLEAAIVALSRSNAAHFGFTQTPTVISVEKINIDEAVKRITATGSTETGNGWSSEVWFVVLEGEIQVIPPPPPPGVTATPWQPFHGCNFEMFPTNYPAGYFEIGGYPCPTKTP